LASQAC